jgi:hypothetical protein
MDADKQVMLGTSMLTPMIAALEVANWRFKTFSSGPMLRLGLDAAAEAATVVEMKTGAKSWLMPKIRRPFLFKLLLPIAEALTPFPLEKYLQYHFSKVRPQTIGSMREFLEHGVAFGTPTVALKELADHWYEELTSAPSTTMATLAELPDPMDDMVYPIPGHPVVEMPSVSAGFSAVNTPVLNAPIVDEPTTALAPVDTVLAVLVEAPKLTILSDEDVHDLEDDHTPLPGSDR